MVTTAPAREAPRCRVTRCNVGLEEQLRLHPQLKGHLYLSMREIMPLTGVYLGLHLMVELHSLPAHWFRALRVGCPCLPGPHSREQKPGALVVRGFSHSIRSKTHAASAKRPNRHAQSP